ncbi:MAG: glycosyltransferase family 4 protein [Proteobacteria bacterium]|nr:glycosyltransferase family 4 protein [Pseudomonadota bacterium]
MKVVHVVRQFSPSVGGLEDTVLSLTRAQRDRLNIDASVLTLDRLFTGSEVLPAQDIVEGVPVRRMRWLGSSRYPVAPSVLRHLKGADVVHVHAIDFFFDYLALTRPLHRRRMIATTHGGFFHTGAFKSAKKLWFQTLTRASISAYDRIVACSQSDAEMFKANAGKRLVLIENGINQAKFHNAASHVPRKTILSFGRFARHKQTDRLLAALKELVARDPEWRLIIAGREADQTVSELRDLARRLGVVDAVRFVLNPTDADLRGLMGEASFFASMSAYEGFGLAAVEAMSAGLIPILSGIPAFRRLVTRAGIGLIVDADDAPSVAAAIVTLPVADADLLAAWRHRALAVAANYDWQEVARQYSLVYENAANIGPAIRQAVGSERLID